MNLQLVSIIERFHVVAHYIVTSQSNYGGQSGRLQRIPELTVEQWQNAICRRGYCPVKQQIPARIDSDVLHWLKSRGKGYQSADERDFARKNAGSADGVFRRHKSKFVRKSKASPQNFVIPDKRSADPGSTPRKSACQNRSRLFTREICAKSAVEAARGMDPGSTDRRPG